MSINKSTKTFARIVASVILATGSARAQETRGTISGHISDSSGARIANAEVRATHRETNTTVTTRTNESGSYTIPYLLPGIYDLTAEFSGFKKIERTGIEVRVNDGLSVDFHLEVGNATETVEVKGGTPLLETANASIGQVQNDRNINELPVQAGNANELVLLTPGVVNSTNLRQRKSSFNSASSQFTTDGNQLYSNEYTACELLSQHRNASAGFTPVAWTDGKYVASRAMPLSRTATAASTTGSHV